MKTLVLLAAILLSGCATFGDTFSDWNKTDKAIYDALTVCHVLDYLQTESAMDSGEYKELNPLLGSSPSDERLAAMKAGVLGLQWSMAETIDAEWRRTYFGTQLAFCGAAVLHNHYVGVRIEL